MRWSMVPVSVAAHSVILFALFVLPIGDTLPTPWPVHGLQQYVAASTSIPEIPLPRPPGPAAATATVPVEAPSGFRDEVPTPREGPISEFAPPDITGGSGAGVPSDVGVGVSAPPPPPPVVQERPTLVRPGGSIREPKRIVTVPAEYPAIAKDARIQGQVIIEAIIDERGFVTDARLLRSIPLLDTAALSALKQWRYTPTLLNGVPVRVLMTITFNFQLDRVP